MGSLSKEEAEQLIQALRPKVPGAHWGAVAKKQAGKVQIAFDQHGYQLGKISDYDTEVTADESWLTASYAVEFPRLKPKHNCCFEILPIGRQLIARVQVGILIAAPKHQFGQYIRGPHQALLEPCAFEGESFRIGQMPRRNGQRTCLHDTFQTRRCLQNGARWIVFDHPLDDVGHDMVASFGDLKFGAK